MSRLLRHFKDQELPLRFAWRPTATWIRAEKLLARQKEFTFSLEDGHLAYRDDAGTEGRVSCRTRQFRDFALNVTRLRVVEPTQIRHLLEQL